MMYAKHPFAVVPNLLKPPVRSRARYQFLRIVILCLCVLLGLLAISYGQLHAEANALAEREQYLQTVWNSMRAPNSDRQKLTVKWQDRYREVPIKWLASLAAADVPGLRLEAVQWMDKRYQITGVAQSVEQVNQFLDGLHQSSVTRSADLSLVRRVDQTDASKGVSFVVQGSNAKPASRVKTSGRELLQEPAVLISTLPELVMLLTAKAS